MLEPVAATAEAATAQAAPGSHSAVYAPNPAAIVVAIDPGHGGCLDWGVPDPSERGVELAEKTITLAIARTLRDRLGDDGIAVVMTRRGDVALAGDHHPPLDCHGPPWRDVNGDGHIGFGEDLPRGTRTRDELQARLDLANLAQADVLVSIHVNSPSEGGETIEIAFSETYYGDETPWGEATARLAEGVQSGVAASLGAVATYDRGDRGIAAHNLYLVAPPLDEPTEERPDPQAQPARGGQMPVVLTEVGSITLRAEHDLLATAGGQEAVAAGIFDGLAAYFADRPFAGRVALADSQPGRAPEAVDGIGPPFWAPVVDSSAADLRLTNTGTAPWRQGVELVIGWERTDQPYLGAAPRWCRSRRRSPRWRRASPFRSGSSCPSLRADGPWHGSRYGADKRYSPRWVHPRCRSPPNRPEHHRTAPCRPRRWYW
ncbi:MAG: N-acetylmuramoyl-L-alanine amidase [Chloroflexi bacterium]|nr:N-acetylmuramoyl-L-alanine amidase [Chloroflexota bacterium]